MTSIIDLLALTLEKAYPGVNIYTEQVGGGFQRPAFFIWQNGQQEQPEVGRRFLRKHDLTVSYFPPEPLTAEIYEDLWEIGDELTVFLRLIEYEGEFCHGRNMQLEITEGTLNFRVSYGRQLEPLQEAVSSMEKLNLNGVID
ncbi:MAG: phage tail terminator family protein [Bacillota bacterium]|jgi:hypothetical protein